MFKEYFKKSPPSERAWIIFTWFIVALNTASSIVSLTDGNYNEAFLYGMIAVLFAIIQFYSALVWQSRRVIDELLNLCLKQYDMYENATGNPPFTIKNMDDEDLDW